jgi:hypothetical protein
MSLPKFLISNGRIVTLKESDSLNARLTKMDETTYDANVRIQDLPRSADRIIGALALLTGRNKWEVVRDALIEYADRHRHELVIE